MFPGENGRERDALWCMEINLEFYGKEYDQNYTIMGRKLLGKRGGIWAKIWDGKRGTCN